MKTPPSFGILEKSKVNFVPARVEDFFSPDFYDKFLLMQARSKKKKIIRNYDFVGLI
jgi:hypothetical protein